jgi:acetolactate synthase-1/3 small subunit
VIEFVIVSYFKALKCKRDFIFRRAFMESKKVLSILVENTPGLTSRISGLFSRRGYNIDSFSAGVTADPRYTRVTIVTHGDEMILEQIEKQVSKLTEVVDLKVLEHGNSVKRELMLVKISVRNDERQDVLTIVEIFKGKVVDVTHDSMILELTGNQDKLEAFLDMLGDYDILELARTGLTGLSRGSEDVVIL